MRIVGGTARGKKLAVFSGENIRPTPDRVREAVFNILASRWGDFHAVRVLDLFAGTGAMALEALSRGAGKAVLVDSDEQAARVIARNIRTCGFEPKTRLIRSDIGHAFPMLSGAEQFDIVFLDPPYGKHLVETVVSGIARENLLAPDGIICAESGRKEPISDQIENFRRIQERRYGSTTVHFFTRSEGKASSS